MMRSESSTSRDRDMRDDRDQLQLKRQSSSADDEEGQLLEEEEEAFDFRDDPDRKNAQAFDDLSQQIDSVQNSGGTTAA